MPVMSVSWNASEPISLLPTWPVMQTIGELSVELSDDELQKRKAQWKAPAPRYTTGVMAKYARLVSSASQGAVTGY